MNKLTKSFASYKNYTLFEKVNIFMFQGTCLCLSGQGQGSVVYCYGDPSARNIHQLQPSDDDGDDGGFLAGLSKYSVLDMAQLVVYTLGILAM